MAAVALPQALPSTAFTRRLIWLALGPETDAEGGGLRLWRANVSCQSRMVRRAAGLFHKEWTVVLRRALRVLGQVALLLPAIGELT